MTTQMKDSLVNEFHKLWVQNTYMAIPVGIVYEKFCRELNCNQLEFSVNDFTDLLKSEGFIRQKRDGILCVISP